MAKNESRRKYLVAAGGIAAAAAIGGAAYYLTRAPAPTPTPAATSTPAPTPTPTPEDWFVWLNSGSIPGDPGIEMNIWIYQRITGVDIEGHAQTPGTTALYEKFAPMLAAKTPDIDVMDFSDNEVNSFYTAQPDLFLPVEEWFPEEEHKDFIEGSIELATFDGTVYGIPHFGCVELLVYRKDIFEKEGIEKPPETWDELVEIGKRLTMDVDGDGAIDVWGFTHRGDLRHANTVFREFLHSLGGRIFDEDGNPAFNDDKGLQVLEFIVDLRNKYKIVPEGVTSFASGDLADIFLAGKTAMQMAWSPMSFTAAQKFGRENIGVAPIPRPSEGKSIGERYIFYVVCNRYGARHKVGMKFGQWITSYEAQVIDTLFEPGDLPTRKSVFDNPLVNTYIPYWKEIVKCWTSGYKEVVPDMIPINYILSEMVHNAWLGKMTPKEALENAAKRIIDEKLGPKFH